MNYNQIAEQLDKAVMEAKATTQISKNRELNIDEAYAVQSILLARRYIRGEELVGLKLGFTSKAKMEQMGVHDMIWGRLTNQMNLGDTKEIDLSKYIHPRAEPEIAFLFKKKVDKILSENDIDKYLDGIAVAIEIIDSRYQNFKFSLSDVIADNCSSTGFVIGEWKDPHSNVQDIAMTLKVNGEIIHQGNSNAILGNPLESLKAASRLALEYGEIIEASSILLAGAATPAEFLSTGQNVSVYAEGLGSVEINCL